MEIKPGLERTQLKEAALFDKDWKRNTRIVLGILVAVGMWVAIFVFIRRYL